MKCAVAHFINPYAPQRISFAVGEFHARSVFNKSRKGFISLHCVLADAMLYHSQKLKERNAKGVGNFIENGNVGAGSSLLPLGDRLRRHTDPKRKVILRKLRAFSGICDLPAQVVCVYHLLTPCCNSLERTSAISALVFRDKSPQRASANQGQHPFFALDRLRGEFAVSIACRNH